MSQYRFSIAEKYAIYRVLGPKCIWCHEPVSYQECELDHIIPESLANKPTELKEILKKFGLFPNFEINSFYNFGPIHNHCNQSKSNRVYEGTPIIAGLLHSIRQRAPEIQIVYDQFLKTQKKGYKIAQLENAIEKQALSIFDIEQVLNKNNTSSATQKPASNLSGNIPIITHQKAGSLGEKSPRQLFNISYNLFDSQKEDMLEINNLIKAKAIQEIMGVRDNYYNYLEGEDPEDLFFSTDSSYDFWMNDAFLAKNFVSYTHTVRSYSTGAAHEQYAITGNNYYLNPLRVFDLSKLIVNYKAFIDKITVLAYDRMIVELKEREPEIEVTEYSPIEKEWLLNENYKPFTNYFFTSDSLTFIFNPYEISAWVYGAHFPSFKFSELIDLFPDEEQFISFLKGLN